MTQRTATPAAAAGAAAPANPVQAPAHIPSAAHPRDAYTGQGGRYRRDPATGVRTPVLPDEPAKAAKSAEPDQAGPSDS